MGEPVGRTAWTMATDEATFSSPRAVDLNDDDVLDIVLGLGQDTLGARSSSAVAIDGATGAELWRVGGFDDVIGTATIVELSADGTPDVVIGGRRGELAALDGADGSTLWTFDDEGGRWFNFYTSQAIGDQDGDGVVDLVAANGGLRFDEPEEGSGNPDADDRHLGTVFVLSGADGAVIESIPSPDRGESYMSPLALPADSGEGIDVIFGTGGETLPGSLWSLSLQALLAGADAEVVRLVDGAKGIIAAPSAAYFTDDCVLDIVVQGFDGTISLIDRADGTTVWRVPNPGFESYSSPTVGYLVGDDDVPDVFTSVAKGVWPDYDFSDYLLIDGRSGDVVWRQTLGTFAPSGFVAGDVNGDGRDEVIFGVNDVETNSLQVLLLDADKLQIHELIPSLPQTAFSSMWLGDLDGEGRLDLIVIESAYQSSGPTRVHRITLPWTAPPNISWGGYLGTHGDGILSDQPSDW